MAAGISPIATAGPGTALIATSALKASTSPAPAAPGSDVLALPSSYAGFGNGTIGVRGGIFSVYAPAEGLVDALQTSAVKPPPIPSPFDVKLPAAKQNARESADSGTPPPPGSNGPIAVSATLQQLKARIAFAEGTGNEGYAQGLAPQAVAAFGKLQSSPFAGLGTTPPPPFAQTPEIPRLFVDRGF